MMASKYLSVAGIAASPAGARSAAANASDELWRRGERDSVAAEQLKPSRRRATILPDKVSVLIVVHEVRLSGRSSNCRSSCPTKRPE